ncbi:MAG: DUF4381 domain-containing protein [Pseudomonadales bacterium]|nr:DUF4381 domain-containing protein [Pseudomonadales bacterium]
MSAPSFERLAAAEPPSGTGPLPPGALDLLNSLKDIHEPAAPGLWPPAPGWWMLAALLAGALVALLFEALRRRRAARPVRAALTELDAWRASARDGAPREAADELAALLRRVALVRYPRTRVAGLSGEDWLAFLDVTSGSKAFSAGPARILGNDRYAPRVELDADTLDSLARAWLRAHRLGPTVSAEALPAPAESASTDEMRIS